MSPFQALYGREPPHLQRIGKGQTPVDNLEASLLLRDAILDDLKYNLLRAQQIMKKAADNHRRYEELIVWEKAYLKLQPYRQKSLAKRPFEKLAAHFYGPFTVL